jgi:hypothetical protein
VEHGFALGTAVGSSRIADAVFDRRMQSLVKELVAKLAVS